MNLSPSPPPTTHIGQFRRAPAARSTAPSSPMSAPPSPPARIDAQAVHQPPWLARVSAATPYLAGIRHIRRRRGQRAPDPTPAWPRSMELTEEEQDRHGWRNTVFLLSDPSLLEHRDAIDAMDASSPATGGARQQRPVQPPAGQREQRPVQPPARRREQRPAQSPAWRREFDLSRLQR